MAAIELPERVLDLDVPPELIADQPVEADGRRRDDVRMLVAERSTGRLTHARAADLDRFLDPGDVLVVNTSPTLPAAVPAYDGSVVVHLSTHLGGTRWVVEVRTPCGRGSRPHPVDHGQLITLAGGGLARLRVPYSEASADGHARLWVADVLTPEPLPAFLAGRGRPIRYGCTDTAWPIADYQTVFARHLPDDIGLGSAEMPSAGRPFTTELVQRLLDRGVVFAPLTLHTGVSSLEAHEPPYAERYRVPESTAHHVNRAKDEGRRVIAVGTTPHPRPRDRRRRRPRPSRRRVDGARDHARARPRGGRRHHQRLARARSQPPAPHGGRRRPPAARGELRSRPR